MRLNVCDVLNAFRYRYVKVMDILRDEEAVVAERSAA